MAGKTTLIPIYTDYYLHRLLSTPIAIYRVNRHE